MTCDSKDREYKTASDEELIRWTADGDRTAFEEITARHQGSFHRTARRILRREEDAADVVQTAMMKMFDKAHSFKADGSFGGWSHRVVRNEALMHIRKSSRRAEIDIETVPEQHDGGAFDPHRSLADKELRGMLASAIEMLAPKYREPFELKAFEGLSVIELAAELRMTEGGVKTRLHRARAQLRAHLLRVYGGAALREWVPVEPA